MKIKVHRDLYVLNTHPYHQDNSSIKISGNPEYTSPILNCFEIKKEKFDTETGKSLGSQIHGIYYDSKQGKFVRKLLNENLVTKYSFDINDDAPLLSEIEFENKIDNTNTTKEVLEVLNKILSISDSQMDKVNEIEKELNKQKKSNEESISLKDIELLIKNEFFNKKVSLRSVYLELTKHKTNRSNSNGNLVETNHLDFLPPVMQIIGFKYVDEKKKICAETQNLKLEFKCKWFNHITKSFSEEYIPYQALVFIEENTAFTINDLYTLINTNELIRYKLQLPEVNDELLEFDYVDSKKGFELENSNVMIGYTLLRPEDIIFKHYFHSLLAFDLITQTSIHNLSFKKMEVLNSTENFLKEGDNFPRYESNTYLNVYDCFFEKDSYYYIQYKDEANRITKRIIKAIDFILYAQDLDKYDELPELNENKIIFDKKSWHDIKNEKRKLINDEDITIIISANCLLRRGRVRHFKLKNILSVIEIKNGNNIFEI